MILGVDALNLAADRRGMGRYVRRALYGMQALGQDIVLIVRNRRKAQAVAGEFDCQLVEPRELRRTNLGAVWYPWNGMRFAPHAPSIVTIYDPFAFSFPHRNAIARFREQAPIRRALRDANAIVTISDWTANELHSRFGIAPERISIAPAVVEPFWHRVEAPRDSPYILFVGGPEERKNARLLFGAFEDAFEDDGVELIVTGELGAADEDAFANLHAAKRRLSADDAELRRLYSGAIAVAVPSLAEGYGIVAIEAMACGAPVVAADAAALPEACAGAALLVRADDRVGWRNALRRVYADAQLRAQLQQAGPARVARMDPLSPARAIIEITQTLAR